MSPSRREADAKGHSRYYYYTGIDCSLAGDNSQFAIKDAFWIIFKFLSTDRYFVGFYWNVFDLIYSVSCESGKMNFKSNVLYFLKRYNKKYILKLLKLLFSNIYYSRPLLIYLLRVTSVTFPRSVFLDNTIGLFCVRNRVERNVDDTNHSERKTFARSSKIVYLSISLYERTRNFRLVSRACFQITSIQVLAQYSISGQTWIQCDKAVDKGRPIYETNIGRTKTEARGWIIAEPPQCSRISIVVDACPAGLMI